MISYKIISHELYSNFQKLTTDFSSQKSLLIQANNQLLHQIQQSNQLAQTFHLQLDAQKIKNIELLQKVDHLQAQLKLITQKIIAQAESQKKLNQKMHETTILLKKALKDKTTSQSHASELINKIQILEKGLITLNKKNEEFQSNQELLQFQITNMNLTITKLNKQKEELIQTLQQKQEIIQKINFQLSSKSDIIEKIVSEYQGCKEQKIILQTQIEKYKESPISKLQQKIQSNQTWIIQLTKTINELRQRCVQLQMDRPQTKINPIFNLSPNAPFSINSITPFSIRPSAPYNIKTHLHDEKTKGFTAPQNKQSNLFEQTYFTNKSRFEETERLKYLSICKQLVQQFNSKLSKIQQEKKSMQERYQTIKLKLNDYQYNQFKYKDKISLYLQKIERYQILTQKQQSQMQNLILQFDQQLNNVIRIKQEQVKSKLEEQIQKYQIEIQKLKDEQQITKKYEEQAYLEVMRHQATIDEFDHQMLKHQLAQVQHQVLQKDDQIKNLNKTIHKINKQLQKYKQSKKIYKDKFLKLEEQGYNNSVQIRRYKILVQQLCQQLQTKSNQNQILKSRLNQNNQKSNRSKDNSQEFYQNLSAKVSPRNNISAGKKSGSDQLEYQFSEIDPDLQRRNDLLLNRILLRKRQQIHYKEINTPAGPSRVSQHSDQATNSQYWNRILQPSLKQSMHSINKSQISSQSQSESSKQNSMNSSNNSPNSSVSSKNSYQSYGFKYLYKQKSGVTQNLGHKLLMHKNSLQ